jgi:putative acetyltransferase
LRGWKKTNRDDGIRAAAPDDIPEIRKMLAEYEAWLDLDLSFQHFADEVATLPGEYALPTGALFIAHKGNDVAGMVAVRQVDARRAEMKRLFVREMARGNGVGRALAHRAIDAARSLGYREVVLDTLPVMHRAHLLYAALGFRPIPPYYSSPIPGTTYLSLLL